MDGWIDRQTDRQINRERERQTDRQTDGRTDGLTDGRTDRQTDAQLFTYASRICIQSNHTHCRHVCIYLYYLETLVERKTSKDCFSGFAPKAGKPDSAAALGPSAACHKPDFLLTGMHMMHLIGTWTGLLCGAELPTMCRHGVSCIFFVSGGYSLSQ